MQAQIVYAQIAECDRVILELSYLLTIEFNTIQRLLEKKAYISAQTAKNATGSDPISSPPFHKALITLVTNQYLEQVERQIWQHIDTQTRIRTKIERCKNCKEILKKRLRRLRGRRTLKRTSIHKIQPLRDFWRLYSLKSQPFIKNPIVLNLEE